MFQGYSCEEEPRTCVSFQEFLWRGAQKIGADPEVFLSKKLLPDGGNLILDIIEVGFDNSVIIDALSRRFLKFR